MNLTALLRYAEASGTHGVKLTDPRGIVVTVACCPTPQANYDLALWALSVLQQQACGEVVKPSVQLVRQGGN